MKWSFLLLLRLHGKKAYTERFSFIVLCTGDLIISILALLLFLPFTFVCFSIRKSYTNKKTLQDWIFSVYSAYYSRVLQFANPLNKVGFQTYPSFLHCAVSIWKYMLLL